MDFMYVYVYGSRSNYIHEKSCANAFDILTMKKILVMNPPPKKKTPSNLQSKIELFPIKQTLQLNSPKGVCIPKKYCPLRNVYIYISIFHCSFKKCLLLTY